MTEEPLDEVELQKDTEIIDEISSKIFRILQTKEENTIINELDKKEYSDKDLTLCIDTARNNNTILTTLVNFNLTRAVTHFISIVKSYKKLFADYSAYINKKNSKGYNALLYSAFRGNMQVFIKLMENGADINSTTSSSGLNALHLAAQGNYPNIIIYLIDKYGMNINSQDNKGNTALHWAVYMDKKQAVNYLMYYNIDINIRDNDNDTALDIAKRNNNVYLIKKFKEDYSLLNQKGNNGDNALNKNNKNGFSFNFKSLIDKLIGNEHPSISLVFCIMFSMLLFFYLTSSKSDAGEIFSKCINNLILLAEQGEDMKNICPWCINYTNEKTHHCFLCKKCFECQEFHEPFINNCVGRNNFSLYMSFLFFFSINFGFKLVISMWGLFWLKGDKLKRTVGFIIFQILLTLMGIGLSVIKIKKYLKLSYEMNFGNLFIKDVKESNTDTNITINNTIDKNNNIQLSTLGRSNQFL